MMSLEWSARFIKPFLDADPSLSANEATRGSIGIVFSNQRNGDIVPVGITALRDGEFLFQYHPSYLANKHYPAIADGLPKQEAPFVSVGHMHPFFDNLPAEGWFGKAQGAALGEGVIVSRPFDAHDTHMDNEPLASRYHRFMMFGRDYPGAVWVTYERLDPKVAEMSHQATIEAALQSRSSISGMQPKLLGVEEEGVLRPANYWETSTHIVKLPPVAGTHMPQLMEYEYMSIVATRALRPADKVVNAKLTDLHLRNGATEAVLSIKRFDRTEDGFKRHFEEINQLLGRQNNERYQGAYADIAKVVSDKVGHEGVKQFYGRLLCQFLLGNTDNHLKNFALLHERRGDKWELAPDYDLAPTANYQRSKLALYATPHRTREGGEIVDSQELYTDLNPKTLVRMGQDFGLDLTEIKMIADGIISNIPAAKEAVRNDPSPRLDAPAIHYVKNRIIESRHSIRDDFCARIDGRAKQLFGTLDKYITIQMEKAGRTRG